MSLLPSRPDVSSDGDPRVVGVDSEGADELLAALSSATARRIVAELHEEPAPPSEIADRVDSSLQNVQYHLGNLDDAGVVEVAGTAYSEKGREMNVYAPADQPLVIVAAEEEQTSGLKTALSRFLGGVAALLVGSAAVQQVFGESLLPTLASGDGTSTDGSGGSGGAGGADGGGASTTTPEPAEATRTATETATDSGPGVSKLTDTATSTPAGSPTEAATSTPPATGEPTATPIATEAADTVTDTVAGGGGDLVGTLPPGALFFLGGFVVLVAAIAFSYS